jgi:hypothetical protein
MAQAPAPDPPPAVSAEQVAALSAVERRRYYYARAVWHANSGLELGPSSFRALLWDYYRRGLRRSKSGDYSK